MAHWFHSQSLTKSLGEQPNHSYTDDRKSGTSMASNQKELGARPKQTGRDKVLNLYHLTAGSTGKQEKKILTFHGNNRKVSLEERWNTVLCKVTCQGSVEEYYIDESIHPCQLQYALGTRYTIINTRLPLNMKISVLQPEVIAIIMKNQRTRTEVLAILQEAVKDILLKTTQFASKDECCNVLLNHLDDRSFRLIASSNAMFFYSNTNNSFLVQIVGPDYCKIFKEFQLVTEQIEIGKKQVQQSAILDSSKQTGQNQMTSIPTVHVKQQIKENLTFHGNNRKEDLESYQLDTSIDSDVEVLVDDKEKEASCGLASISPSYQVKSETIGSVPEEIYKEERTKQNDKENGNVAAEVPSKGPSSEKMITYQLKRGKIGQYYLIKSDSCPKPFRYTPKYGDVSMDEEDDLLYDGDHCFAIDIEDGRITLDEITDAETTNSTPVTESDGRCLGVVSASEDSISGYGSGDVGALIDQFQKQMVHDKVPVLSDQAIGDQKEIEMKIAQSTIQSGEEEHDIHDDVDTVLKKVPMITKCKEVEVHRYEPEPEEPINPCTVIVSGSGEVLSDLEILELYFESTKRSGGGDIANITYDEDLNVVVITFENEEDAQRVIEKTDHKVKRQTLTVEQFKPMKKKNVHRHYKEMVSKEVAKKVTKQKLPSCH